MKEETFSFSRALELLKSGKCVTRQSWTNAKLYLVPGSTFQVSRKPLLGILTEGETVNYRPHIDIFYNGEFASVWTPTSQDLIDEDWVEVNKESVGWVCV